MNLRNDRKIKPDFSMASMTDLVFLLLIFFMLVSTLINTHALDLLLPSAKSGKSGTSEILSVSITKEGKYYINKNEVSWGDFERSLVGFLANKDRRAVAIHAEQGVVIEKVVNLLDVLNKNDIEAILAVAPK